MRPIDEAMHRVRHIEGRGALKQANKQHHLRCGRRAWWRSVNKRNFSPATLLVVDFFSITPIRMYTRTYNMHGGFPGGTLRSLGIHSHLMPKLEEADMYTSLIHLGTATIAVAEKVSE